ncbi:transposase [Saccharomonospora amisosensis]|nr:transposase [Saccharomonospora amisosensis]
MGSGGVCGSVAPWRDVPERYGHWQSIYQLFRRWQREGVWPWILCALRAWADAVGLIDWQVSVDSRINRAHQHAAGARRRRPDEQVEPPGDEPADHALGRSRCGFTTKIHLACEQGRRPLSLLITADHRRSTRRQPPDGRRTRRDPGGASRTRTRPVVVDYFADSLKVAVYEGKVLLRCIGPWMSSRQREVGRAEHRLQCLPRTPAMAERGLGTGRV